MTASLLECIAAGRTDLVLELPDPVGDDALAWCAYYGDVSALRTLLARGADLARLGADLGLNGAAFHGHWQLCQFLLEQGAPVDGVPGDTGETPLHSALCSDDRLRYDPVVQVLLGAGADVHAATLPGIATGAFMRDCRTRGETALHRAAAFGTPATLALLLDAGAERATRDTHGDTALGWASWYRRPTEVLRLLCHGDIRIHPEHQSMRANLIGQPQRR